MMRKLAGYKPALACFLRFKPSGNDTRLEPVTVPELVGLELAGTHPVTQRVTCYSKQEHDVLRVKQRSARL